MFLLNPTLSHVVDQNCHERFWVLKVTSRQELNVRSEYGRSTSVTGEKTQEQEGTTKIQESKQKALMPKANRL